MLVYIADVYITDVFIAYPTKQPASKSIPVLWNIPITCLKLFFSFPQAPHQDTSGSRWWDRHPGISRWRRSRLSLTSKSFPQVSHSAWRVLLKGLLDLCPPLRGEWGKWGCSIAWLFSFWCLLEMSYWPDWALQQNLAPQIMLSLEVQ